MARKTIRRSQAVVPFGVGAIFDLPGQSLMSAGLDVWPEKPTCPLNDDRLARRLGVTFFRQPPPAPSEGQPGALLPFIRFPLWHFCPRCRSLKRSKWNETAPPRCDSDLGSRFKPKPGQKKQPSCSALPEKKRWRMVPVRFVIACQSGHIDDFPWELWAHRKSGENLSDVRVCNRPQLRLNYGRFSGLGGLKVVCETCESSRTMSGSAGPKSLEGLECAGNRPWLGPHGCVEGCDETPRMLQRGATNLYFPKIASAILIPPFHDPLRPIIDDPRNWGVLAQNPNVDGSPNRQTVENISVFLQVDPNRLYEVVQQKMSGLEPSGDVASEEEFRHSEYSALSEESSDGDTKFVTVPQDISLYEPFLQEILDRVVLVEKLAETRALTGFSRIDPPPYREFETQDQDQLSLQRRNWLPAIRVYGEGLFFRFKQAAIDTWTTPLVEERLQTIIEGHHRMCEKLQRPPREFPPRFFLLHTLAHILVRRLSFECGYGSSSLRERLYCWDEPGKEMSGILIYTAAGDSEGTMGGLVQQGKPSRLESLFRGAIQDARWCSSDPLCIESSGQGIDSLNRAACHACALLPETSCEEGNRYLDRGVLVGTPSEPALGFFSNLINATSL